MVILRILGIVVNEILMFGGSFLVGGIVALGCFVIMYLISCVKKGFCPESRSDLFTGMLIGAGVTFYLVSIFERWRGTLI